MKQDVLPGRYTVEWFQPSRLGEYHLFCAQYCGTQHANMIGKVFVMEPADYQQWLAGVPSELPMQQAGEALYRKFECNTCHGIKAPTLAGLFGSQVKLQSGETVTADESYLRESILNPRAQLTAGYLPIMPSFKGQLNEEQILLLVTYIKSLRDFKQSGDSGHEHSDR